MRDGQKETWITLHCLNKCSRFPGLVSDYAVVGETDASARDVSACAPARAARARQNLSATQEENDTVSR